MRVLLLAVVLLPALVYGGWTRLRQFDEAVSCGYFYSAKVGFIGTCGNNNRGQPEIWRTTDGGATWTKGITPTLSNSRLTSIFMKDEFVGYASMWGDNHAIWKTTDGGKVWLNHTWNNDLSGTCVYATEHALILTCWPNQGGFAGGPSLNDGRNFQSVLQSTATDETNGIDFVDGLRGVATPGPRFGDPDRKSPCFFTLDGGRSWQQGGLISESWGIYGLKGTTTFFALPEGNQQDPQTQVIRSTDVGQTWQTIYTFPSDFFTGHIGGYRQTLYVQVFDNINGQGFFRSDNLGQSWKNVGGPANARDTRFVVTGCNGEVVYAFDNEGFVWKTTDGGDGTLSAGTPDFTLDGDSLHLSTICANVKGWIPIGKEGCADSIVIDAVTIENDPTGQFTIDTATNSLFVRSGSKLLLPISYTAGSAGNRSAKLRVRAHSGSTVLDTTFIITGSTGRLTPVSIGLDTLQLTTICTNAKGWIPISFGTCDDSITIDAMFIELDQSGQFMLDTLGTGFKVYRGNTLYIPVVYFPGTPGVRSARVRIYANSKDMYVDTTIEITGRTVKLPEPYVPDIERGEAGDTVQIPIYLDKTVDPFSITDYEVRLSFNTDLLEPIDVVTFGTLSRNAKSVNFAPLPGGVSCRLSLPGPITEVGDLTQPLVVILAKVFLTKEPTTSVLVDSFNVVSGTFRTSLLGCSERTSTFTINYMCGDSTISAFIRTGQVSISGIRPNPNYGGTVDLDIGAPEDIEIALEAINPLGVVVKRYTPLTVRKGMSTVRISTSDIVSGLYYLRLRTSHGSTISQPITIVR